jgi:hypothetical protein
MAGADSVRPVPGRGRSSGSAPRPVLWGLTPPRLTGRGDARSRGGSCGPGPIGTRSGDPTGPGPRSGRPGSGASDRVRTARGPSGREADTPGPARDPRRSPTRNPVRMARSRAEAGWPIRPDGVGDDCGRAERRNDETTPIFALVSLIGKKRVGDRPDRYEPRAVKRRPKPYPLLRMTRKKAKALIKRGIIPYEKKR